MNRSTFLLPAMILVTALALAGGNGYRIVKTKAGKKGQWTASVSMPVFTTRTPLTQLAESTVRRLEMQKYNEFLGEIKKDFAEMRKEGMSSEWGFESATEVTHNTPRFIGLATSGWTFLGGAHGMSTTVLYNFGYVDGKPKRLTIHDVVHREGFRELKLIMLAKAMKLEGADWINNGDVNDFTENQMNNFRVDGQGLVFEFDAYELGSYASGPQSIGVTWAELKPLMRANGPLPALAR